MMVRHYVERCAGRRSTRERDPKERCYLPFAKLKGCMDHPAEGRETPAIEAARNYKRLRRLCPEDIRNLEERIAATRAA